MQPSRTLLALTTAALLAIFAGSAQAERLNATLTIGGTAAGTVAAPGDVATIGFLALDGTNKKLAFTVKDAKGSKLAPDVRLIAPDGSTFDLAGNGGKVTAKTTSWLAKLPGLPQKGLWRLEVRGANNSVGGFTVTIKGSDTTSSTGTATVQLNGKQDVQIVAGDGMALTITAKRSAGSQITPQIVLLDPNGSALEGGTPFVGSTKTGALTIKAYRLPTFGTYTIRFSGADNGGGTIAYKATTAPAKVKGTLPTGKTDGSDLFTEPLLTGKLTGTGQAAGGGVLSYRWVQVSGPAVTIANAATANATFAAPASPGSLAFQLSVAENGVLAKAVVLGVEVGRRPLADAGRTQSVAASAAVTLDGAGSLNRRSGTLSPAGLKYVWRQVPGDTASVTLTGGTTASPTFTAPTGTHTLHFGLTVDDGNTMSFEDVATVRVGDAVHGAADAGREQYVPRMSSVQLSGLSSRTTSGVLDAPIQWVQVSGPAVTLAAATTPWPSFTAPRSPADLVFEMQVDGTNGAADRVAVHVRADETNLPPNAKGNGPLNAPSGSVPLSASGTTDPNSNPLTYRWTQVSGAPVTIDSPSTASGNATIPSAAGLYLIAVQANDGLQYGAPDIVSVRNSAFTAAPLAIAGPDRSTTPGVAVSLDGRNSARTDGTTGPLTFQWTQISGKDWFDVAANLPSFIPTAGLATFTLPSDVSSLTPSRTLLFQLVVSDGAHSSQPDIVAVTFTNLPLNGKPVVTADATDKNPVVGTLVTLLGTVTDRDGDPTTVKWTKTSGPAITLSPNDTTLNPTFTAPDTGTFVFQLVANDGFEDGAAKSVTVTVDRKPIASATVSPVSGGAGTLVTMDGSSSTDPEGQPLTYKWTQTSGTTVTVSPSLTSQTISFTAPSGGVGFTFVVNDGRQNSDVLSKGFSTTLPPTVNPSASGVDTTVMAAATGVSGNYAAYASSVTLNANPGAGGPFTFTWRQINTSGTDPVITLSSTTAQNPTFIAPSTNSGPLGQTPQATFGVRASDGVQTSNEATVVVKFFASLNSGTSSGTSTTVMAIISNRCVSCHGGTNNSCPVGTGSNGTGYGMSTKTAFLANSRNVNGCAVTSAKRLPAVSSTGQSASSYFYARLSGAASPAMPSSGGSLTAAELALIKDWIDQGVFDN